MLIRILPILFSVLTFSITVAGQDSTETSILKSGIELGTGLSFTGYNANLAYTATFNNNVFFAGPKLVYSDANALFDTPWGMHMGYRRLFPVSERFQTFASVEYQWIVFNYTINDMKSRNNIQEFHFSYGMQYRLGEHWMIGNTLGLGGYLEKFVDPFDGRTDRFNGFSSQFRIFGAFVF